MSGTMDDRPSTVEEWEAQYGRPNRFVALGGKMRRFFLSNLRPQQVKAALEKREGECDRCGLCCNIAFRCPFLKDGEDCSTCTIYEKRPTQCALFPIDPRDLKDVARCSYTFRD